MHRLGEHQPIAGTSVPSERIVKPWAHAESERLAALRDALLPKLISGELRVEDPARFVGGGD
jgi:hypothetical protein